MATVVMNQQKFSSNEVVIHQGVDVDACVCVALSRVPLEKVHFWPNGLKEFPLICPCCHKVLSGEERILDHSLLEKERFDANGIRHSAAFLMPEVKDADPKLIAYIERLERQENEERKGVFLEEERFSLQEILSAIKAQASTLYRAKLDYRVLKKMVYIINGINTLYHRRKIVKEWMARIRIVEVAGYKFALFPEGQVPYEVAVVLNEEYDVSGGIFHQGYNLGVSRYLGRVSPDLTKLQNYLPGWFVHRGGYLACWGSRLKPATLPPPVGTPQNPEELLGLMRQIFEKEESLKEK